MFRKMKAVVMVLFIFSTLAVFAGIGSTGWAQVNGEMDAVVNSVVAEAESGELGTDFTIVENAGAMSVTISTDVINTMNPGSADRVATYTLSFPEAGTYEVYGRIYVGSGAFDDDSYFIPAGFGAMDPIDDASWVRINGLAGVGYTAADAFVDGGGSAGSSVWKWVNMSQFAEGSEAITYTVPEGALDQIFQIGARENGLYIDKFVFGKSGLLFSVDILMNGGAGLTEYPRNATPLAEGQDKFLGCQWDDVQAVDFPDYWNQIVPGNAGKWGSVEGNRDQMNWSGLDAAYNEAQRYNMIFKEHTLLWGAQQPAWMADLDSAEQRQEIEEWFAALAERYGSFDLIDVVNEPIHNAPNGMITWGATEPNIDYAGALGGAGESGWDWIIEAFRLARQYFPDSKLILNEYSVINSTSNTQKMIEIVNLLKAENLIDGIGEQAHAFTTNGTATSVLKNNLDALAATGIPIYISEFDIDGLTDLAQLQEMRRVFSLFWEHPGVAGITLWGYRYGLWRNDQGAFLITEDGRERLAMDWLKAYVNDTLVNVESIDITSISGDTVIDQSGATLSLQAEVLPSNATIKNITWSVQPGTLATIDQSGVLTAIEEGIVKVKASAWDGSGVTKSRDFTIEFIPEAEPADSVSPIVVVNVDTVDMTLNNSFEVLSSEDSYVFLVPENTSGELMDIRSSMIQDSLELEAGSWTVMLLEDQETGVYWIYARDSSFNVSKPDTLVLTKSTKVISSTFENDLLIYPNPSKNGSFIITGLIDAEHINVLDMSGKQLAAYVIEKSNNLNINLDVKSGLYLLEIVYKDKSCFRKIIVE